MQRPTLIFIVEDDPGHAEALRISLGNAAEPFEIQTARSIGQYRELLGSAAPDVVLADLNLMDGTAFDLLSNPPELLSYPVVVMTSFGDEHMAVQVLKAGAHDYTVKSPETFREMPHILSRALREWKHIQERKQAQNALKESEERFRSLAESALICIVLTDHEGECYYANDAWTRMTGLSMKESSGKGWTAGLHAEDKDLVLKLWREGISTMLPWEYEYRCVHKSGTISWVHSSVAPMKNSNGALHGFVSTNMDITSRKQAEAELRKSESQLRDSEERFRLLVENAPQGIFVQTNYRFAYLNPTAVKYFGAGTAAQLIGQPVMDRFHEKYHALVHERTFQLNILFENVTMLEEVWLRLDGTPFDVEVVAVPVR